MITFNNMVTLEIPGLSHDKVMAGIKKYTDKYTKGWRLVFKDAKTEDSLLLLSGAMSGMAQPNS